MVEADTKTELCVRHALQDEAHLLSCLALRSKSHWGYKDTAKFTSRYAANLGHTRCLALPDCDILSAFKSV
jgi:hypothetical protein